MFEPEANNWAVARDRYNRQHNSNIFGPPEPAAPKPSLNPAGKRRDQGHHELFGHDSERDRHLRRSQPTFQPKGENMSAKEKSQHYLSTTPGILGLEDRNAARMPEQRPVAKPDIPDYAKPKEEGQEVAYPLSKMCGEEKQVRAPDLTGERAAGGSRNRPSTSDRLMSADMSWHQAGASLANAEKKRNSLQTDRLLEQGGASARPMSPREMRQREGASTVLGGDPSRYTTPRVPDSSAVPDETAEERRIRQKHQEYSSLFGRATPIDKLKPAGPTPRNADHHLTDWTDARTEERRRGDQPRSPHAMKMREFYSGNAGGEEVHTQKERLSIDGFMRHDESQKVRRASVTQGNPHKSVHQAHLESTLLGDDFYQKARTQQECDIVDMALNNLRPDTTETAIRDVAKMTGCHVVRVVLDVDPVSNRCKGRARVQLREGHNEGKVQQFVSTMAEGGVQVNDFPSS